MSWKRAEFPARTFRFRHLFRGRPENRASDHGARRGRDPARMQPHTAAKGRESGSPELRAGTYVRLSVADTGVGMDKKTLKRAVEPFYSAKGAGK